MPALAAREKAQILEIQIIKTNTFMGSVKVQRQEILTSRDHQSDPATHDQTDWTKRRPDQQPIDGMVTFATAELA